MLLILTGLLFFIALLRPVTFRINVQHAEKNVFRIDMAYLVIRKTWQSGQKKAGKSHWDRRSLLHILRSETKAQRFIRRHIHLDALDALVLLHTGDAATASLLACGLQGLVGIPPVRDRKIHIRVMPDFFRGYTTLQAQCIIRVRLGIILLTILMLPASRLQRKARTAYGTSHW